MELHADTDLLVGISVSCNRQRTEFSKSPQVMKWKEVQRTVQKTDPVFVA